ncbi:DUF6634 family protein [Microvirga arabica]|uniref:DUF6634 family protein n=1 Tax=Microvirga arabica TaxID=1128671 RepID=A0ABV6YG12_9HYPH
MRKIIRERFLSLHHDLDLYAAGRQPTEGDLQLAPVAEMWRPGNYPGTGQPCIQAQYVLKHPRLGTAPGYCSSPVYYIDLERGWARTQGQLIRLGRRDPAYTNLPVPVVEYNDIDRAADLSCYQRPPADIEPKGPMGEDPAWHTLWDWFEEHTGDPHGSTLVYIARRWNEDIATVYIKTDSWMKAKLRQIDRESADPDDYNAGSNFN